jgi:hypothetical protein
MIFFPHFKNKKLVLKGKKIFSQHSFIILDFFQKYLSFFYNFLNN